MFIPKEVVHNYLMSFEVVRHQAKRFHRTGMNRDPSHIQSTYDFYKNHVDIEGKRVLELGPGQTIGVLQKALRDGAAEAISLDIVEYLDDYGEVRFQKYDGKNMPLASEQVDVVWSSDVFEHLRYPRTTVAEVHRILVPGGLLLCKIDLRDHYKLSREADWNACLKYAKPVWKAMTWNRSAYTNRLRASQWGSLFAEQGFETLLFHKLQSTVLRQQHKRGAPRFARRFSLDDWQTYRLDVVVRKPRCGSSTMRSDETEQGSREG